MLWKAPHIVDLVSHGLLELDKTPAVGIGRPISSRKKEVLKSWHDTDQAAHLLALDYCDRSIQIPCFVERAFGPNAFFITDMTDSTQETSRKRTREESEYDETAKRSRPEEDTSNGNATKMDLDKSPPESNGAPSKGKEPAEAVINDEEAALYDRQIRLWGLDGQQRSAFIVFNLVFFLKLLC